LIKSNENNVLIALIPNKTDFEIAKTQHWYRIPVKPAPRIVKNNQVEIIAFYHPKSFETEKFSIKWYARVFNISIVKRKDLFPGLPFDLKTENEYYKIEFSELLQLPQSIVSIRHRRLLFIPTSEAKFFRAPEINYLFNDSPLENILWAEFINNRINAERQFFLSIANNNYFLDFALFCKVRNINIECDGDKFHTDKADIQSDKKRNNLLESKGWSVLRFTTHDIKYEINSTLGIISDTINKYGGIEDTSDFENYKYINGPDDTQLLLFD
jgi:very-short-patch-repair endonuclease